MLEIVGSICNNQMIGIYVVCMQDIIHEIPMDYGKFHMMHGVMLLLSTGRSECQYCYLCMHYIASNRNDKS